MSTQSQQAHRGRELVGASAICVAVILGGLDVPAAAGGGVWWCTASRGSQRHTRTVTRHCEGGHGRGSSSIDLGRWSVDRVRESRAGRVTDDRVPHRSRLGRHDRAVARSLDATFRRHDHARHQFRWLCRRRSDPTRLDLFETTTTTSAGTSIVSSFPSAEVRRTRGSWCRPRRGRGRPVTTWSSPIRRPCRAAVRSWRSPTRPTARPTASPRSPSST